MSTYYTAQLILGCKVPRKKLFSESSEPMCGHVFDAEYKFCPYCGKQRKSVLVAIFDEDEGDHDGMLGEFDVILCDYDDRIAFVGKVVAEHDPEGYSKRFNMYSIGSVDMHELKRKLKIILESWDMWNEDNFGFHPYLDIC